MLSVHSFSPAAPTPRGCTQLPLAYRLHCILKNGKVHERQPHCLRFLRSSRQVDCARKNRELSDLNVLAITSVCRLYLAHPDEPVHVIGYPGTGFEVSHHADGIALDNDLLAVSVEDGQRESEQHLGALKQETVPDS